MLDLSCHHLASRGRQREQLKANSREKKQIRVSKKEVPGAVVARKGELAAGEDAAVASDGKGGDVSGLGRQPAAACSPAPGCSTFV